MPAEYPHRVAARQVCGKHDLMMFRNPHGCTEFKGAWRDGSKEWSQNPSAAKELNYVPDPNDGLFWMAKDDAFRYFQESPSARPASTE